MTISERVILREFSERQRADGLQARLAAIVAASNDAIISTTLEGVVTSWNSGAERIIGFKAEDAIGKLVHRVIRCAVDDIDLTRLASPAYGAKGGPGWPEEIVCLRKDGLPVTLSVVACYLHDPAERPTEVAAICRDISAAKRRDLELRRSHDELSTRDLQMRALAERLHAVRDEERTRISRTVHDELGQLLSALKMDLHWIGKRLGSDAAPSAIAAKVDQAVSLVDRTVQAVQRIALDLRSSALDAFGLSGAVREEARKFEERSEIATEVMVKCESEPARDVKTALFNIFQELLTNVGRHARASSVRVVLDDSGDQWTLLVEDDGAGFPVERHSGSLGILGMKERAESVGGRLDIESKTGRGTVAVVRVPHPA
jgi:two-component system sensor histidine kinase UhpB